MRFRVAVLALVAVAAGAAIFKMTKKGAAPDELSGQLRQAEQVTVFRLDANDHVVGTAEAAGERLETVVTDPADRDSAAAKLAARGLEDEGRFHGYKVVRSAVVDTPEQVMKFVGTLEQALAENVSPAKCFVPDYGIRFTSRGVVEDLVISLKCLQFVRERRGDEQVIAALADRPGKGGLRAAMNRLLDGTGDDTSP